MKILDKIKSAYKAFQEPKSVDTVKTSEKSTYVSPYYDKSYLRPYNPDDLVGRKGLDKYREMMLDDQVRAVMYMKKLSVLSTGGKVEANEEDENGEEKAEFLNYILQDYLKGSFNRNLFKILSAYQYGYSVSEKVFDRIKTGQFAGKIGLKQIKTRPPESFKFNTDDYGNLDKVIQYQEKGDVPIEPKYLIVYTYNEEFDGNFYGQSDLRAAYTAWWNKKFNRKFRNIRNERYGMPLAVGYYRNGASQDEKDTLFDAVKNLQSKSAATLPKGMDDEKIIEFIESKAQQGKDDAYNTAINYEDRSIARALLTPDMLGFSESKFGSRALGETQFDLYLRILSFLRNEAEKEVIFEQIIKQLIDLNYPNTQKYPEYKFNPLTEEDKQSIVKSYTSAIKGGAISPTPKGAEHTKELLGYPTEEEETEPVPEVQGDEKDVQFSEKMSRRPNKYERKMNFSSIRSILDSTQEKVVQDANEVMTKVRDNFIEELISRRPTENNDIQYIRNIEINAGQLEPIFTESFQEIYQEGQKKAKEVIDEKQFQSMASLDLPPEKAIEWFETQSEFAVKGMNKELTDKTKQRLLTGLSQGKSTKKIIEEVEKVFTPYIEGKVSKDLVENPHRIETIVRTNFTTAYNKGIKQESQASDVVKAYEYSSVLDSRTTAYCEAMDGKIFKKTNSNFNTPPAHFNCRSMIVPVVRSEDYELSGVNPQEPKSGVTRSSGF